MNKGSKWPNVGRAKAFNTVGDTSEGPGPIKVLTGGIKDVKVLRCCADIKKTLLVTNKTYYKDM